jgi:hypothetical protein
VPGASKGYAVSWCIMLVRAARGNAAHIRAALPRGPGTVRFEDQGSPSKKGMLCRVTGIYT